MAMKDYEQTYEGPFELENVLIEHAAVAELAVVASPDEVHGEVLKAFIILAPSYRGSLALTEELQIFVKNLTASYKYPWEIEYVEALPKTVSGKIRRIELRDMEKQKKLFQKSEEGSTS
jgi:acetyl-CoA synthetase/medium-chain acyl-CoA synthetase